MKSKKSKAGKLSDSNFRAGTRAKNNGVAKPSHGGKNNATKSENNTGGVLGGQLKSRKPFSKMAK